jgi:hypothetical protein
MHELATSTSTSVSVFVRNLASSTMPFSWYIFAKTADSICNKEHFLCFLLFVSKQREMIDTCRVTERGKHTKAPLPTSTRSIGLQLLCRLGLCFVRVCVPFVVSKRMFSRGLFSNTGLLPLPFGCVRMSPGSIPWYPYGRCRAGFMTVKVGLFRLNSAIFSKGGPSLATEPAIVPYGFVFV